MTNNVLYRKNAEAAGKQYLLVVPAVLRLEILRAFHDDVLAGHLGFAKTFKKIKERYFWFGMRKDVEKYCKTCKDCQTRKGFVNTRSAELKPVPSGEVFWRWGIYLLGPFPVSADGNKRIVVATEYATRFAVIAALPSGKAADVAKFIYERIICVFGSSMNFL